VTDDGNRPDFTGVEALALESAETSELGEEDARQRCGGGHEQVGVGQLRNVVIGVMTALRRGSGLPRCHGIGPGERRELDA
jgi:hypothetical protein